MFWSEGHQNNNNNTEPLFVWTIKLLVECNVIIIIIVISISGMFDEIVLTLSSTGVKSDVMKTETGPSFMHQFEGRMRKKKKKLLLVFLCQALMVGH